MPLINVSTNLRDAEIPENFEREVCKKMAELLGKPTELITVNIRTGARQIRNGSTGPMIVLEIHGIGVFDRTKNPTYTPHISQFIRDTLNLTGDRIELLYHDLPPHDFGKISPPI